jgi:hypothetical protein
VQKFFLLFTLVFISSLIAPLPVFSVEKIEVSASFDFCTDYVWRGLVINDDPVFQPSVTVTKTAGQTGLLAFNVWGNYDFTDVYGTKSKFSEIDLTASYSLSSGSLRLETGIIHYTFPNTASRATTEMYINAGYGLKVFPLAFSLGIYYDFDEIDGFYLSAKIASYIPLISRLSLEMALLGGYGDTRYNRGYFSVSNPSFIDILFTADLTYKMTGSVSLAARGQYMSLLDSTLKDAVLQSEQTHWIGCLSVIIDF